VKVGDIYLKVPAEMISEGQGVSFAIRPEALKVAEQLSASERPQMFGLKAKVAKVEYLGYMTKYDLELGPNLNAKMVSYDVLPANLRKEGELLEIFYDPRRVLVY
jgi:ABC-type Fe3+/spermidine/putrescine transport system ATPase subunit